MVSGLSVVARDQASWTTELTLDGVRHVLPPDALGARIISEGVLVPDQPVWVRARVRHEGGSRVLTAVAPDRPLSLDLRPRGQRVLLTASVGFVATILCVALLLTAVTSLLR